MLKRNMQREEQISIKGNDRIAETSIKSDSHADSIILFLKLMKILFEHEQMKYVFIRIGNI